MHTSSSTSPNLGPAAERIAIHVLNALTTRHRRQCPTTLDDLVEALHVRRPDVRRVVSALHRAGYLDASRMRLTLLGFAVGASIDAALLPTLRARASMLHSQAA